MRRNLGAVALALLLAACGSADEPADAQGAGTEDVLEVTVDAGDGTAPETWTLTCDGAGATEADEEAACAHLAALDDPFAPLAEDVVCTEQYGGPETARVVGRWDGEPVDLELSRSDGCRIAQWDALGPLLALHPE